MQKFLAVDGNRIVELSSRRTVAVTVEEGWAASRLAAVLNDVIERQQAEHTDWVQQHGAVYDQGILACVDRNGKILQDEPGVGI